MTRRDLLSMAIVPAFPFEDKIRGAEKRVFGLINDERRRSGLDGLGWSETLADVARQHSVRMMVRGYFSHVDPDYGASAKRLDTAGVRWSHCSENILRVNGWEDPLRLAVISWMTSPGHRANILSNEVSLTGVGIALKPLANEQEPAWFMTQVFIAPPLK